MGVFQAAHGTGIAQIQDNLRLPAGCGRVDCVHSIVHQLGLSSYLITVTSIRLVFQLFLPCGTGRFFVLRGVCFSLHFQIHSLHGKGTLIQASVITDLQGVRYLNCRTVQVLVNQGNLIPHHPIIHGNSVRKGIPRSKSCRFPDCPASGGGTAHNLISQNICLGNPRRTHGQVHQMRVLSVCRCRHTAHSLLISGSSQHACTARQTVHSGVIADIVNSPGLLRKLLRIFLCLRIRRLAPAHEEIQNVFLRRGTGQPHESLLLIRSVQIQRHTARTRRICRRSGIAVHAGKEETGKLLLMIRICLVVISPVISQMELPVHSQLCEHIGSRSLRARSHFVIHIPVLEAHAAVIVLCLGQHRKVIIRNLRNGIASLVNTMSDLMGNPPSEISAALIPSFRIGLHRHTVHHSGCRPPFNSYMIAGSIHERSREHSLITNIQVALRYLIHGIGRGGIQSLMLVEEIHHIFHGIHGIQDCLRLLLCVTIFCTGQNLLRRQGQHHGIQQNIRRPQDTVCLVIIVCHLRIPGILMRSLMQAVHSGHIGLQLLHIILHPGQPLVAGHLIQIQSGHLHTAADTNRILVTAAAAVLHIQRSAGLKSCCGPDFGYGNLIGSHLKGGHLSAHGRGLRMILGGNQLKVGLVSCLFSVMAHIDHNLFPCSRCNTQRLPCVQSAEAPAHIACGNAVVNLHRGGSIQPAVLQNRFRCGELALQELPIRIILSADGIHRLNLRSQRIYDCLGYIRSQYRMKIIFIEGKNLIPQLIVIVKINF